MGSTVEFLSARNPPNPSNVVSAAITHTRVATQAPTESETPTNAIMTQSANAATGVVASRTTTSDENTGASGASPARDHRRREALEAEPEQRRQREHREVGPDEVRDPFPRRPEREGDDDPGEHQRGDLSCRCELAGGLQEVTEPGRRRRLNRHAATP